MPDDSLLLAALVDLRERGALGEVELPAAIERAEAFVRAIPDGTEAVLDLGSGGGLPGLVLAMRLPHVGLTLIDRRQRRMDLLRQACSRLGVLGRVRLLTGDVRDAAKDGAHRERYDVVTARSFGPPVWTARCAVPFLREGGSLMISEPPRDSFAVDERWPEVELRAIGFDVGDDRGGVRVLTKLPR